MRSAARLRFLLRHLRRRGHNLRHVVIVGAGKLGTTVAERLHAAPWAGFAIHGFYDDNPVLAGTRPAGLPVLGTIDRLLVDIDDEEIDQVWIALPLRAELRIRELIDRLQQTSVQVRFVPDIYNFNLLHHSVSEIEGLPVINLTDSPLDGHGRRGEDDRGLRARPLFTIVTAPAMVAIADRRQAHFARPRALPPGAGHLERPALRHVQVPHDAGRTRKPTRVRYGPRQASRRATRFGAFLRRYSLDELPQLFNVLRGEDVDRRPAARAPRVRGAFQARHPRLHAEAPGQGRHHRLGTGQRSARRHRSRQRIQYDLYYIEHWSIWFDLRIIGLTLLHILRSENAH